MNKKRIVVKLGTGVLQNASGGIDAAVLGSVLSQARSLMQIGIETVVISSGAIQSARLWIRRQKNSKSLKSLKDPALAAIGQPILMHHWMNAGMGLDPVVPVAQVLVTDASIGNRTEWKNTEEVIAECFESGVIPIVNYNDAVSFAAIEMLLKKAGDNDKLAATFAEAMRAEAVLFLTEAGGVHNGNPAKGKTKRYIEVNWANPPFVDGSSSFQGRGGMGVKLAFAIECRKQGIKRVAISGLTMDVITRFARGQKIPTIIGSENILEE